MVLRGPHASLRPTTAKTLATLQDGGAGITANAFGKGRAIAYNFYPVWQYWISPDRTYPSELPQGWSAAWRKLRVAPASYRQNAQSSVAQPRSRRSRAPAKRQRHRH